MKESDASLFEVKKKKNKGRKMKLSFDTRANGMLDNN